MTGNSAVPVSVHAVRNWKSLVALTQKFVRSSPVRASTAVTESEPGTARESSTTVSWSATTVTGSAVAGEVLPKAHCTCSLVEKRTWYGPGRTVADQAPSESVTAWKLRPRDGSAMVTKAEDTG